MKYATPTGLEIFRFVVLHRQPRAAEDAGIARHETARSGVDAVGRC
jgi:hypothetical protein